MTAWAVRMAPGSGRLEAWIGRIPKLTVLRTLYSR
jgi:hypothetical protein